MNTRRFLTITAALLLTLGQTLILVADTAASAQALLASAANTAQSSGRSSNA